MQLERLNNMSPFNLICTFFVSILAVQYFVNIQNQYWCQALSIKLHTSSVTVYLFDILVIMSNCGTDSAENKKRHSSQWSRIGGDIKFRSSVVYAFVFLPLAQPSNSWAFHSILILAGLTICILRPGTVSSTLCSITFGTLVARSYNTRNACRLSNVWALCAMLQIISFEDFLQNRIL
jgi:hypothetical protein